MALFKCKLSVLALDHRGSKTVLSKSRFLEAVNTSGEDEETNASVGNT